MIAPGAGEGLAGLPGHKLARLGMARPLCYLILLGCAYISLHACAVVNYNMGLERAHKRNKLLCLPVILALAGHSLVGVVGIGEIKPKDINLSIVCQKLRNLVAHILGISAHISALVELGRVGIVTPGMIAIEGEIGVMPVDKRIVEANLQPLGAERLHIFTNQIPAKGCVHNIVVGVLGIKEAEALVMLGGKHRILHSCGLSLSCPLACIKKIGVKALKIALVDILANTLIALYPFVPCRQSIKTEVDKHSKPVINEPLGIADGCSSLVA